MAMGFRAGMIVTVLHQAVDALQNFVRNLDSASVRLTPGGSRLSASNQTRFGLTGSLASLPGARTGAELAEFAMGDTLLGMNVSSRVFGLNPTWRQSAIESQFQAQRRLAAVGPEGEAFGTIEDMMRRNRSLGFSADSASAFAAAQSRMSVAEFHSDPGLAMARQAARRSGLGVTESERLRNAAAVDVGNARTAVTVARFRRDAALGASNEDDTVFGSISPTARRRDQTSRATILEAELRLQRSITEEINATKRLEEASLMNSQRILENKRAQLEVSKAELAQDDRKRGGVVNMALMDPMQRTSMVRSLQRLASGQDVSRDELQMLASFGPTAKFTQDKIFEKYHNNPEVAQLFEAMKQTGPMSPRARKELEIKTFFDLGIAEAEATKIAKKISDEMMPNMIKLINDKLKGDLRIQESRNQMANAAQAE
jgi:hypothetical protein